MRRATWFARLLTGVLPTLLLCGWLGRRLVHGTGGLLALGIYSLATPAAAYAHLLYGHQLTACLLWIGAVMVVDAVREDRRVAAAIGGCLAAASVTVEYSAAFAGVPLAVFVLLRAGRRWQAALMAAIGAAGPIVAARAVPREGLREPAAHRLSPGDRRRVRGEARRGFFGAGRAELAGVPRARAVERVGAAVVGAARGGRRGGADGPVLRAR
jgi:hypothetical protein